MDHTVVMNGGRHHPSAAGVADRQPRAWPRPISRLLLVTSVIVGVAGCELLPGRDDFEDRAFITNETDEAVVIHWFDAAGEEERIFELAPDLPPGGQIDLSECDPRGLVARTTAGEEVARRAGPTCGGWVVTDER